MKETFNFIGTPKKGPITFPMETLRIDEVASLDEYAIALMFKSELVGKFVGTKEELKQYLDDEYIALHSKVAGQ